MLIDLEFCYLTNFDFCNLIFFFLYREVIECMTKLGEANTQLKQLEITLGTVELDKNNAESELMLAKEKEQSLVLEIKQLQSRVGKLGFFLALPLYYHIT